MFWIVLKYFFRPQQIIEKCLISMFPIINSFIFHFKNTKYFDKIYEKYRNKIIYYIFKIINDYSKAEDLAQEVFVYILNNKFDLDF